MFMQLDNGENLKFGVTKRAKQAESFAFDKDSRLIGLQSVTNQRGIGSISILTLESDKTKCSQPVKPVKPQVEEESSSSGYVAAITVISVLSTLCIGWCCMA